MVAFGIEVVLHVKARPRGDISLAADDRLDSRFFRFFIKIDGAVHNAVVGHRNAGLPQFLDARDKVAYPARAVEQAVFAVDMKMHKSHDSTLDTIL